MVKLFIIFVIALMSIDAPDAHATELLSIQNFHLASNQYVAGFQIQTWRIRIRAVCSLPIGWMITAGRELDQGGQINGQASGFMTNLDVQEISQLQNFVLIDDPPSPVELLSSQPPAFKGSITIGTYKSPQAGDQAVHLEATNIILKPAARCPAPR